MLGGFKHIILLSIFLILTLFNASAFSQVSKWKVETSIEQFSQNFNWSIAGNMEGNSPNILSELIWQDLKGPKFNLQINKQINQHFELVLGLSKHTIKKGAGSDTDYLENNRREPFFEQQFLSNKGNADDYLLIIKYTLTTKNLLKWKPYFGLNLYEQKLHILDVQDGNNEQTLNSIYRNMWKGAVLGIETCYEIGKITITLDALGGYYQYLAKAQWNLNEKFNQPLSFKQNANGYKFSIGLKSGFSLSKNIDAFLGVERQYAATFSGIDEAYLSNGSIPKTKFNGAEFNSIGIKAGTVLNF